MKICRTLAMLFPALLLLANSSQAQTSVMAPAREEVSKVDQVKNPVSWLSWGADLRLRNEYFHHAQTIDPQGSYNEQDYFRFRSRVWMSLKPLETITLNTRLSAEPRVWNNDASYTPFRGNSGTDWTYGIFDQLNLEIKSPGELPLTITVGRQDLVLGEGWLVLEGTPNDGSWTLFLDAARLTYDVPGSKTTVEVIGIWQAAEADDHLETINNQNRLLTDQDETGFILHVAHRSLTYANTEAYFIYKKDKPVPNGRFGDEAEIYTFGLRMTGVLNAHWKYSMEGALQTGHKADPNIRLPGQSTESRDLEAYGVNARLVYAFKDKLKNQVALAYEYLSGDDPDTGSDEMFDVLWGRWPRWSELYNVYSYWPEARVGQISNLHRLGPAWAFSPAARLDCSLTYNALFADEQEPTRAWINHPFSFDGNFRGHYFQAFAKYRFNRFLSGHLWGELVAPGNFYTHDNAMSFLRAELMLSF